MIYEGNPKIKTLLSRSIKDWSTNLLKILNQIPEKYIFLWLDDLFLTGNVDSELFQESFRFIEKEKGNHIHFSPSISLESTSRNKLFGFLQKGVPYRVSAVGFWDKDHLKQILLLGENPWQFEIFGSYRSKFYDGYFTLNKQLYSFIQIVEKGKIFREAHDYCIKNNIKIDFDKWQIHTFMHKFKSDCMRYIFNCIIRIPWKLRVSILDFFRKALVSY